MVRRLGNPKYSRNPKAAAYFINYLCQEDVALANMETTGYVSSVAGKKVLEAMSDTEAYPQPVNLAYFFGEEGRNAHLNPIMYPDSSIVARCAMIHDLKRSYSRGIGYVVEGEGRQSGRRHRYLPAGRSPCPHGIRCHQEI